MSNTLPPLLSPQELASQLSALEKLITLFPRATWPDEQRSASTLSDDATTCLITESSTNAAEDVRAFLKLLEVEEFDAAGPLEAKLPQAFVVCLKLKDPSHTEGEAIDQILTLMMDIHIPLRTLKPPTAGDNRLRPHMSLRQPDWMSFEVLTDRWHSVEMFAVDVQRYDEQDVAELISKVANFVRLVYFDVKAPKAQRL